MANLISWAAVRGGVLTLVVYALVVSGEVEPVGGRWRRPVPALVLAALVFAVLATQLGDIGSVTATAMARPGIGGLEDGRAAGIDLFTRYLVPFELLSVLLLGAIFGALAIARREERS